MEVHVKIHLSINSSLNIERLKMATILLTQAIYPHAIRFHFESAPSVRHTPLNELRFSVGFDAETARLFEEAYEEVFAERFRVVPDHFGQQFNESQAIRNTKVDLLIAYHYN